MYFCLSSVLKFSFTAIRFTTKTILNNYTAKPYQFGTFVPGVPVRVIKRSRNLKGTVLPAERCDLVGVKLENVHELFQAFRICAKGVAKLYGSFYYKRRCN